MQDELIQFKRGEIYGYLFENKSTGLPRGVYWNLLINCESVRWEGTDWETAFLCDWLCWPITSWTELDGMTLSDANPPELVEASFYLSEHNVARPLTLSLRRIPRSAEFWAEISGVFDLEGFGELDCADRRFVSGCKLDFTRLVVGPELMDPALEGAAGATAAAAAFLDLTQFQPPAWENSQWVFNPIRSA